MLIFNENGKAPNGGYCLYLNTSHVNLQLGLTKKPPALPLYLNTSHVNLQRQACLLEF